MLTMTFGPAYNMICSAYGGIPKLVEGTGLENREVVRAARGFESYFLRHFIVYLSRGGAAGSSLGS